MGHATGSGDTVGGVSEGVPDTVEIWDVLGDVVEVEGELEGVGEVTADSLGEAAEGVGEVVEALGPKGSSPGSPSGFWWAMSPER